MVLAHVNTTQLYDAATSSSAVAGAWDLETHSDNPSVSRNSLSLASYWGDTFDFDDADGETFKWGTTRSSSTWVTTNIGMTNPGKYYAQIGFEDPETLYITNNGTATSLTDARICLSFTDYLGYANAAAYIEIYKDTDPDYYVRAGFQSDVSGVGSIFGETSENGTTAKTDFASASIFEYQFRVVTDGTLGYAYYRITKSDITSNDDWTLIHSGTMTGTLTKFRVYGACNYAPLTLDDFVAYGDYGDDYATTAGTWTTPTIGANTHALNNIVLNIADCNATNYIRAMDIYEVSDLTTPITSLSTGSITRNCILTDDDFDNALTPCTGSQIAIRMYFTGDGSRRPSISTLSLVYDDTESNTITWGSESINTQGAQ